MFYLVFALKIPLYPGSSLISSEQSPRTERLSPGLESSESPLNKAQFSPFRLCVFFSQYLGGPMPSQSPYKREAVGVTVRGKMLDCRLAGGGGTTSQTKAGKFKKKKKRVLPAVSRKNYPQRRISEFWPPVGKRTNQYGFKPLRMWSSVTAATGSQFREHLISNFPPKHMVGAGPLGSPDTQLQICLPLLPGPVTSSRCQGSL